MVHPLLGFLNWIEWIQCVLGRFYLLKKFLINFGNQPLSLRSNRSFMIPNFHVVSNFFKVKEDGYDMFFFYKAFAYIIFKVYATLFFFCSHIVYLILGYWFLNTRQDGN